MQGDGNTPFADHLAQLFACRACPNVFGEPVTGAVPGARIMLVGQAPGPREVVDRRPFAWTAGQRLFRWFRDHLGISEEEFRKRVHIAAVIRCFPGKDAKGGGDRVPDETEIANCGAHLDREIRILRPELIIAVGTLASQQLIGISQLKDAVGVVHRAERAGHVFDVIVLPHPSGRSTWLNKKENVALLERSLKLVSVILSRIDGEGSPAGDSSPSSRLRMTQGSAGSGRSRKRRPRS
jgi:uracil-DNA glycosylase